jgi:UDP-glucose 4-epimerase
MKVLVTGSAGFLGGHLMQRLKNNTNVEGVNGVDNIEPTCGGRDDAKMLRFSVDVSDFNAIDDFIKTYGITHIVHAAALGRNLNCQADPLRAWQVNTMGTVNVLEAARLNNVQRVVCVSSNICLCPDMTTYKATKLSLEHAVEAYQRYGLSCQAVRPCNIHGPGQSPDELQPCAFRGMDNSFKANGYFTITGDGTQSRDFVDVRDVARAIEMTLFSNCTVPAFDIATGRLVSMNEVASMLGVPVVYAPKRPGDAMTIISDIEPAKQAIGFEAEIQLEDTILDSFPSVVEAQKKAA